MEKIYLIGIIFMIIEIGLYLFSPIPLIIFVIFLLGSFWILFQIRIKEIYILSFLFLIRILSVVNFNDYQIGDMVKIKTDISNGVGKIEKIENKIPLFRKNIYLNIEEGKYEILGEITQIKPRYILVEEIEKAKKEDTRIEIILKERVKNLRNYLSNSCVNLVETTVMGEKKKIYKEIEESFRRCGVSHLLAISGLHLGIISGAILYVLNKFSLKREVKYSGALFILSIYFFAIKLSPSVIRAYIMAVVYMIGNTIYEKNDIKKSFAVALIINLFIYPNSLGDISFIMSYLCVFLILWIYQKFEIKRKIKNKSIYNLLIFLLVIQVGIIPITLYFFGTMGVLSYFTNLILTPIGSIFIISGFIAMILPKFLLSLFSLFIQGTYDLLEFLLENLKNIPYLTIEIKNGISFEVMILTYILSFIVLFKKEIKNLNRDIRKDKK